MDPVARAYEVWQKAQVEVVSASAKLHSPLGPREMRKAKMRYEDAVDECAIAKSFYDLMREITEQENAVRCQPKAC